MPDESSNATSRTLVVLLHAFERTPASLDAVVSAADSALGPIETLVPELETRMLSTADPNEVVADVLRQIDQRWDAADGFDRIHLVGHSIGALLVRKVYVAACGEHDAPFEEPLREAPDEPLAPRPWAASVERIVLLAGINRGWSVTHHLSLPRGVLLGVGSLFGALFQSVVGRKLLILQIRRGAPFITQLRLQWLAMRTAAERGGPGGALTVQLLGTIDDLVAPEDNIDLVTGRDFVYLDVDRSGHGDIIEMDDPDKGPARRRVFQRALTEPESSLVAATSQPGDFLPQPADPDVTDVIFVIHGIRDKGYWTHKIARRVKELGKRAEPPRSFATETSSYGYFPMLPFLFFRQRRRRVEWLMDEYTQNRALYPRARFHFIGHSNGTYLLAKALEEYPACSFQNVVFAGSVVRTDYDWGARVKEGRVGALLNYVASGDWVVAIFPKSFQLLGWQDLGSAGHDGFEDLAAGVPGVEVRYAQGGHGAALDEDHWQAIADFVVHGPEAEVDRTGLAPEQAGWVKTSGRLAPVALAGMVLAIVGGALWLRPRRITPEVRRTLGLGAYLAAVWKIVTRL